MPARPVGSAFFSSSSFAFFCFPFPSCTSSAYDGLLMVTGDWRMLIGVPSDRALDISPDNRLPGLQLRPSGGVAPACLVLAHGTSSVPTPA